MEHLPYLGNVMTQLAERLGKADGSEDVASCPGWTIADVGIHVGTMHRWAAATILSGQRLEVPKVVATEPLIDWYAGTATALLAAVQAVEPDEATPNFSLVGEIAAFWPRRQLHETTVHLVDVMQALGELENDWEIPTEVAVDGIDEVLSVFFPRLTMRDRRPEVSARIRIIATDTDASWLVAPSQDPQGPPILLHTSLESDAEVSGSALDLYLGLWQRTGHDRLTVDGDSAAQLLAGPLTP